MPSATLTSKGQITVPRQVRQRLGLRTGDRVAFRERADGSIVIEPETIDLLGLHGMIRPRARGVTVDDMKDAVRRKAAKR